MCSLSSAHDGVDLFGWNKTSGYIDADCETDVASGMQNAATLTLAGLCLGIALTGLFTTVAVQSKTRERLSLGLVYGAFGVIIALPLIMTFAQTLYPFYMPLVLVMMLTLPPAVYHYVLAKTTRPPLGRIPWRDLAMPLAGCLVCFGFWVLPEEAKAALFISGELPPDYLPAILAITTFVLILCWLVASFVYLLAVLRRLAAYRAHIRQLYSNVENRDLRWVDWVMALLVMIWAAGAVLLADENLGNGGLFMDEALLGLTACCLLFLTIFASNTPSASDAEPSSEEPDTKYARSAMTANHAAKLAKRIGEAMQKDALYIDPNLSLQKLSQHVGALPNQVSQTLNQKIGATFFDYVARWRIEASKPLILAGDDSVLTVALQVGFNSKSTFYKAFKRETGVTPKAYRLKDIG
jgi:AraC-like DNA-binding protein